MSWVSPCRFHRLRLKRLNLSGKLSSPVWPLERVDWEKSTEEGQAATTIAHQAELIQADIIVIGTHGRSGLPHMLLGSVAEKVVRTASCPVLTIRPEAFQFEMP